MEEGRWVFALNGGWWPSLRPQTALFRQARHRLSAIRGLKQVGPTDLRKLRQFGLKPRMEQGRWVFAFNGGWWPSLWPRTAFSGKLDTDFRQFVV